MKSNFTLSIISLIFFILILEGICVLNENIDFLPEIKKIGADNNYIDLPKYIDKLILESPRTEKKNYEEQNSPNMYDGSNSNNDEYISYYAPNQNFVLSKKNLKTGRNIYTSKVEIDSYGRRSLKNKDVKKFLLIFGCSFAWGEGVNNDKNFPYLINEGLKSHQVYNMSIQGGSINDVLPLAKTKSPLLSGIKQSNGVALYIFKGYHIYRAYPSMRQLDNNSWLKHKQHLYKPRFKITENLAKMEGYYVDLWYYKIISYLSNIKLLKYLKINLPINAYSQGAKYFYKLLINFENKLIKEMNVSELILVNLDQSKFNKYIIENWKKKHKKIIDISMYNLEKDNRFEAFYKGDGHPTELTHLIYSKLIVNELKKLGIK